MGGNAIKSSERIDKNTYNQYVKEISEIFPELTMDVAKSFYEKKDFGDIDLIVKKIENLNIKKLVKERLNPAEIFDNGPYFSFLYKNAQVDFILTSENDYISTVAYMSWNDLSNFIGRTARSLNFKFGSDGLSYEYHLDDHYKITIPISKSIDKILEFLGYDYVEWLKGFNTEEDIFKYAASSTYFNPLYFTLEDQSHNDRVRNKKRKMYQKMLQYIIDNKCEPKAKLTKEERFAHVLRAENYFDINLSEQISNKHEEYAVHLKFKELFNGDIVKKITGLDGKLLGRFITELKSYYPNFKQLILLGGDGLVNTLILYHNMHIFDKDLL